MKYFRLSLIIIALFNYQYIKAENVDEYKIEIVLFKFNKVLTDELFDINLNEPDLNETIEFYDNKIKINKSKYSKFENISTYIKTIVENEFDKSNIQHPSIWYRDSDDLKILKKFNNNIGRNNDLKLLGHHSWIQNIPEYDESKYLRFKNTDYGFYLKLYKKRFLHLDLKTFIKDERNSDIQIFIDKEHRIFNEEIYFFDHPAFGILFTINKI